MDPKVRFVKVQKTFEHFEVLYTLLQQRTHTISHKKLPNFEDHILFVKKNPYRIWYLIQVSEVFLGSIYILNNNCVGINVLNQEKSILKKSIDWVSRSFKPLPEIKSVRPPNFYLNVNLENTNLISALTELNARPIQLTYLLNSN